MPPVPAVLRLVQRAVLGRWRATGEDLYREVVRLTEPETGQEILVSGCGNGAAAAWLARRTGAVVTGVDPDEESIERAEELARSEPEPASLHFQHASLDDLPHEDAVFDVSIGEPALSAAGDAARAVSELVRVTRPMGAVVLLQPTWTSEIATEERETIVDRLGVRPRLLVEWKQMLRDAGVVDLQVEDWTDGVPSRRGSGSSPVEPPGAPRLTLRQKMQIVGQAWRRWGWQAAREAVAREMALIRELSRERTIGFQLIKGVKWPHPREA